MNELDALNRFYKEYKKNHSDEEFKNRIISFYENDKNDINQDEEFIENRKDKKIREERFFFAMGYEAAIISLIFNMCSVSNEKYSDIKDQLISLMQNGYIEDIDKILDYEIRFYSKIDESKLIDALFDCYFESRKGKNEPNEAVVNELYNYYGDEQERLNSKCKDIDSCGIRF